MNICKEPFCKPGSKCLVIMHQQKPGVLELSARATEYLQRCGLHVDQIAYDKLDQDNYQGYIFALLFSGDGLALLAGRVLCTYQVPILVINTGIVGFMAAFDKDCWQQALDDLMAGNLVQQEHRLIDFSFAGKQERFFALNEIFLAAEERCKICNFILNIDGDESLGLVRADGLMVSTPTGSTAYALACGGPILAPGVQAMLILAVNPYAIAYRPVLIPAEQRVKIRVAENNRHKVLVIRDGECLGSLENGQEIDLHFAACSAKFIYKKTQSFYSTVQKKLGWNAGIFFQETGQNLC